MYKSTIFLVIQVILLISFLLNAQVKKELTLEDIFSSDTYVAEKIENLRWLPDGSAFTFTENNKASKLLDIYKYEVETGNTILLLSGIDLKYNNKPIKMSNYSWTNDGKYLMIEGPEKEIWRHSRQAPFYLYEVETEKINALGSNDPNLRNVKLSPDGKSVGFVREHNIYIANVKTSEEKQLTFDGSGNILNGEFDWVYEEEFSIADGWCWSPDGKKIAFWRFDQTRVKEFYMIDEMHAYNKITPLKYPKTGEENSIVKIGVIDLENEKVNWMDTGDNDEIYIPRIYWTNSPDQLAILRLNRLQNYLELLMTDSNTGF